MSRWPWPADSVLDRAKRIAWAYRAALAEADPVAAQRLDDWAVHHGQSWVHPTEWPYGDDELLTLEQVADLCHVQRGTVYRWHQRGLPYAPTVDGIRVKVADLVDWEQKRRRARKQ